MGIMVYSFIMGNAGFISSTVISGFGASEIDVWGSG